MKRNHILIPEPKSNFNKVKCDECNEEQIVYSHASTRITCNSCGNDLATPTGSLAKVNGTVSGKVD